VYGQKWEKGTRVRYSAHGLEWLKKKDNRVGTVDGYSRKPGLVPVVWDGTKTQSVYSEQFLEEVPSEK